VPTSGCTRTTILAAAIGLLLNACGGSPTTPDPRIPPATGSPDSLRLIQWNFDYPAQTTTVEAEAMWGMSLYTTSRDVTVGAVWTSSNPAVAAVVGPGRLAAVSPGDARVTALFREVKATALVRVYGGEPPLWVLEGGEVSAFVFDASRPSPGNGLVGATVELTAGHNAGRTAVTGAGGIYTFFPPFVCGPVTARATKEGYADAVGSSIMCMNGMPRLTMTPQ
jgi:hypothetical protein